MQVASSLAALKVKNEDYKVVSMSVDLART